MKEIDQNAKIAKVVTHLTIPKFIPKPNDDEEDSNEGFGGFKQFDRSII
jgi:hypothetical protein